jgi:hypothetical protein
VSKSALSGARKKQFDPGEGKVQVGGMAFAVADTDTNTVHAAGGRFGSHAQATEKMAKAIAADPALADRLVIVPESELVD